MVPPSGVEPWAMITIDRHMMKRGTDSRLVAACLSILHFVSLRDSFLPKKHAPCDALQPESQDILWRLPHLIIQEVSYE